MSFGQRRLLLLQQLDPQSAHYNVLYRFRLEGPLDVDALRNALSALVSRHDVLRARFPDDESGLMQIAPAPSEIDLPLVDLSGATQNQQLEVTASLCKDQATAPFDLAQGDAYRFLLLRFNAGLHMLVSTVHHIVTDGQSADILIGDVGALYRRETECATENALPELRTQFQDFAAWQHEQVAGAALEAGLAYWRDRLAGAPETLDLPTSFSRPAMETYAGRRFDFELPEPVASRLMSLGRSEGCTPFMVVLALANVLLSRYSGQDDLVLGTASAGRDLPDTERLIGFFVNTVPLRADLAGEPSFRRLLRRIRTRSLDDFEHAAVPFEEIVDALKLRRDAGRSVMFQAMVLVKPPSQREWMLTPELRLIREEPEEHHSIFDLIFTFEQADTLRGSITYNTSLFEESYIVRMAGHLAMLAETAVAKPNEPACTLQMLTAQEQMLLVRDWNRTELDYDSSQGIHTLVMLQALQTPEAPAVICSNRTMTYRELDQHSNRLAQHLRRLGSQPGSRIGICLPRTEKLIVAILAVLKAGSAYVPLDPAYPVGRLDYMVRDAGIEVLLTAKESPELLCTRRIDLDDSDTWDDIRRESSLPVPDRSEPRNAAYVIYTSGSTGQPKGVVIEHAATVAFIAWARAVFPRDVLERTLASTSMCFDLSIFEMFVPLATGGAVVVVENVLDLPELNESITLVNTVPSAAQEVVGGLQASVRVVNVAGEPLKAALVRQLYGGGPLEGVYNLYGPTETTTYSTWCRVTADDAAPAIGRPIGNTQVYVLDRHLGPVPLGFPGELYIGGHGLARGYLNRPEMTAEKFVPHPFATGERLYRTGDLVRYRRSGDLEYLGRLDHQVKIRGFRIELEEVRLACLEIPGTSDVAVVVREDEPGDRQIVAYFVPSPEAIFSAQTARAHLSRRLPGYMIPSGFIVLDALPLTLNGKLDRSALPGPAGTQLNGGSSAPRTAMEEAIASVIGEVLHVEMIGVHDNFFELGGHSLMAMRVVSRLKALLGRDLPLKIFFENPTVDGLSTFLRTASAERNASTSIIRVPRTASMPASFSQRRLFFLQEFDPAGTAYNVPVVLRIQGALNVAALSLALEEINRRHEVLRTHFSCVDGDVVQRITPPGPLLLSHIDLGLMDDLERDAATERFVRTEIDTPFDLNAGPVWRQLLVRLGETHHLLVLTTHHAATDGWSLSVLAHELATHYDALVASRPVSLQELSVQYSDYAAWYRREVEDGPISKQMEYWREQLRDAPLSLSLPVFQAVAGTRSAAGASHRFTVPADLATKLKAFCLGERATLFMGLLAAFQALLGRYSGQEDFLIGTPVAGRGHSETEGIIGCFVNTLVLRADLSGTPHFRELLARARNTALGAYSNQDVPIERLVQELVSQRDLSQPPLLQALLVLQNTPPLAWRLHGLDVTAERVSTETAKFDLTLFLREREGCLDATLTYASSLFDQASMAALGAAFVHFLGEALAFPDLPIKQLAFAKAAEVKSIPAAETTLSMSQGEASHGCVWELFAGQAARTPEAPALTCSGKMVTYGELLLRATGFARRLRVAGIGPEQIVAFESGLTYGAVVAILGASLAGAGYAALDKTLPPERLRGMLEELCPAMMLSSADLVGLEDAVYEDGPGFSYFPRPDPAHLAYVIFTSGSTGRPKGVAVEQRQVESYVRGVSSVCGFTRGESFALLQPLHVDASLTFLLGALTQGGCLHLMDTEAALSAEWLANYLQEHRIDYFKAAPTHLSALWQMLPKPEGLLPRKALFVGGEPARLEWLHRVHARRKDLTIWNQYGPTETTVGVTIWRFHARADAAGIAPLGEALPGVELYLLDAAGKPVAAGARGEICIGGAQVTRGYLQRPAETATRYVPDPFGTSPGARLYRTGDMARRSSSGLLEYLGREDDQVKIRGLRVELGEVENALAALPGVRECAAQVSPAGDSLIAFLCWHGDAEGDFTECRGMLRDVLPAPMIPTAWHTLRVLPRTAHGKLDRQALARWVGDRPAKPPSDRTPASEGVEGLLLLVWKDVLKKPHIALEDNFFDLGGHSLLAMQITSRVRQIFNTPVPLRLVFEAPTVVGFAAAMTRYETVPGSVARTVSAFEAMRTARKKEQPQT